MGQEYAARVYYLLRGRRWLISEEAMFWALGLSFGDVCVRPQDQVDAIPRGPDVGLDGGMFLCPTCSAPTAVYWIEDGARRHIANEVVLHQCLGLRDDDIFTAATPAYQDLFPVGWEIEADCDPDAVETDSCGACGQKFRVCDAACTWSAWSLCQGDGDCAIPAAPATPPGDANNACAPGAPGGDALLAALALALVALTRRRRA